MHSKSVARSLIVVALLAAATLVLRAQASIPAQNPRIITSFGPESFVSRVVTTDLAGPWEVAWGPDGFLWITERVGKRITRVNPADGSKIVAVTVDEVHQTLAQDGLLGMALHPDLLKGKGTDYVYVAYTYDADPGNGVNLRMKIRRYTYDPQTQHLSSPADVLTNLPHGCGGLEHLPGKDSATRGGRFDSARQPDPERRAQPHLFLWAPESAGAGLCRLAPF